MGNFSDSFVLDGVTLTSADESPFIARIDATGKVQWARLDELPPNGRWQGWSMAEDPGGPLYLSGVIVPEPYAGVLGATVIRRIETDGRIAWARFFDLPGGGSIRALAVAADGTLSAFGALVGTFDFGGGPLTARTADADTFVLRLAADGQFISAGFFTRTPLPSGGIVWSEAVSATGLVAVIGAMDNTAERFVHVFDSAGELLWSRTFTTYGDQTRVTFINDDVVLGTGVGALTDLGDGLFPANALPQFAVARFDRAGHLLWTRGFQGAQSFSGLAVDSGGSISLSGFVSGLSGQSFAFGSLMIPFRAERFEISFVGKLDKDGNALWVNEIPAATSYVAPQCGVDSGHAVRVSGSTDIGIYLAQYAP